MKKITLITLLIFASCFVFGQFSIFPKVQDSTSRFICSYPVNTILINLQTNQCWQLLSAGSSTDNLSSCSKKPVPCYNPYEKRPDIIISETQPIIKDNSYGYWRKLPEGKLFLIINKNGQQFIYEQ